MNADDKTAAERAAEEEFQGLAIAPIAIPAFAAGAAWAADGQRTADRETIAQTIDRHTFAPSVLKLILARSGGTSTAGAQRMADAVLAVLVPADLIRADTLDAAAEATDWTDIAWRSEEAETVVKLRKALRARAADYRKAANT